jgi:large subunit ribosomal protein L23
VDPHQVIIRPVISERSYNLIETEGQYTFDVSVARVNTANVKSKPKRQGLTRGRTATWKKAVVKLAPGESIELFEGV